MSRRLYLILLPVGVFTGLIFFGLFAYTAYYSERVLPGVHVGTVPVGGMTPSELTNFLQAVGDRLVGNGLRFRFEAEGRKKIFFLSPVVVTEGTAIELVSIDAEAATRQLLSYGKDGNWWSRLFTAVMSRGQRPSVALSGVAVDQVRLFAELQEELGPYEKPMRNASVRVTSLQPLAYERLQALPGQVFDYEGAVRQIQESWSRLEPAEVIVEKRLVAPEILDADLEAILPRLPAVFERGALILSYKDSVTRKTHEWTIDTPRLADWLTAQHIVNGTFAFGLDEAAVKQYLETVILPNVAVAARDAKFSIDKETGKVTEFQGSRPGREVDFTITYETLNDIILQRTRHDEGVGTAVALAIKTTEPNITTGEVNNLGITEVLGVGHSNFSGSPTNRIKNIRHAALKLNGVLIKPGEDFSALKYTEPFTEEGGYLPELVIKGDELKPEIGGGLCQIGTTLFRMAMNGGMPISERRNHSLVVSYYNDLENGLPGTDATIYEPAPDFKFKNDTGNYILIQTDINEKTGDLFFTLWGTSDGRKGWFEAPALKRWIPHGETKEVKTTKLAPGERKCQKAFRGAEASFSYHRLLPDGTPEDRVFSSYYRPLPEICLVGVKEEELDPICDPHEACFKDGASELSNEDEVPVIVE